MKRAWYLILEEHARWRLDISPDGGQGAIMFVISLVGGSW